MIDASGEVQERYAYSAYGTPLFLTSGFVPQAGSSFDWETLYAGYRWETGTELFHVRHRVLNSVLGTWCQRDPDESTIGANLLAYAESRPPSSTDPYGLFARRRHCIGSGRASDSPRNHHRRGDCHYGRHSGFEY